MGRKINQAGIDMIKRCEGLRLKAYCDVAGVWTIGYGHTAAAGAPNPEEGMTITETVAEALLRSDLVQYENTVARAVTVELNDNQFASLVSFAYNIGHGNFRSSTLLRWLNAGDYESVKGFLTQWVYAGGKRVQGLVNRRAAEAALWSKAPRPG